MKNKSKTLRTRKHRRAQKRKGGTRTHRRQAGRTGSIRSKQLHQGSI